MTSIERIQTIVGQHDLDVLIVYASDGSKLDYVEGSPDDVCTALALIPESFDGIVTAEAYKAQKGTVRGKKADADKPFRWKIQGRTTPPTQAAPMAAPVVKEITVPDIASLKGAAESRADARIAEHQMQAALNEAAELRGRLAVLEAETEDAEVVEDDEDDEPMGIPPTAWFFQEDATMRMMGALKDLFRPSASAVPATSGITDDERKMLTAFRKFKAARPDDAKSTEETLFQHFGEDPGSTPPEDDGPTE